MTRLQPIPFARLTLDWSRTYLMGVVNATPDSFSDSHLLDAVTHGEALLRAGADIVDVGGESTRPGAPTVGSEEELRRVLPVVRALSQRGTVSIDTYKAVVADAACTAGAEIVNDISGGLLDEELLRVCARHGAALVLGHLRGKPADMQSHA